MSGQANACQRCVNMQSGVVLVVHTKYTLWLLGNKRHPSVISLLVACPPGRNRSVGLGLGRLSHNWARRTINPAEFCALSFVCGRPSIFHSRDFHGPRRGRFSGFGPGSKSRKPDTMALVNLRYRAWVIFANLELSSSSSSVLCTVPNPLVSLSAAAKVLAGFLWGSPGICSRADTLAVWDDSPVGATY